MKKIVTIVGARPQIIKSSAISRKIAENFSSQINEIIVHTGQHYDQNMSDIFFSEMGIPMPKYNLNVGSGSHGNQTANIIKGIEEVLTKELPHGLLVYGDTNSTLASSLAASKIGVPIFHVEAGLRSYNMEMPEEINRVLTDHISSILFCPTTEAYNNLLSEGFGADNASFPKRERYVYVSGDIMYDNALHFSPLSNTNSEILNDLGLEMDNYLLFTMHRNNNTDEKMRLNDIVSSLLDIVNETGLEVVFPLHPRTEKSLQINLDSELYNSLTSHKLIHLIPPTGYLDTIALLKNARIVITDSGGLQKEAFFFKKPCVIMRSESEWIELIENGNALLADADSTRIKESVFLMLAKNDFSFPEFYGSGDAAGFILSKISNFLDK